MVHLLSHMLKKRKKQYVGQTLDKFESRRTNYKFSTYAKGESWMQEHLF